MTRANKIDSKVNKNDEKDNKNEVRDTNTLPNTLNVLGLHGKMVPKKRSGVYNKFVALDAGKKMKNLYRFNNLLLLYIIIFIIYMSMHLSIYYLYTYVYVTF
jgi:hypothetical protein